MARGLKTDDLDNKSDAPAEKRQAHRKRMASEDRREEFLTKAIEFFAKEGFESSTRELARRLGVTQPLLYRYFPSKDDLIAEVYNRVYLQRWKDEWADLLTDRSRPLRDRLIEFYDAYTTVVFKDEWLRIYLFSGLKGVDINRRYLRLVRARILEPILREVRFDAGLSDLDPSEEEVEFAWIKHGGIIYYGVRTLIYEASVLDNKSFVIETSVDGLLDQVGKIRDAAQK